MASKETNPDQKDDTPSDTNNTSPHKEDGVDYNRALSGISDVDPAVDALAKRAIEISNLKSAVKTLEDQIQNQSEKQSFISTSSILMYGSGVAMIGILMFGLGGVAYRQLDSSSKYAQLVERVAVLETIILHRKYKPKK